MDLKAGLYMVERDKDMSPDKRAKMMKWLSSQLRRLQASQKMDSDVQDGKDEVTL